jgi:positive regulator of sigma E activity
MRITKDLKQQNGKILVEKIKPKVRAICGSCQSNGQVCAQLRQKQASKEIKVKD